MWSSVERRIAVECSRNILSQLMTQLEKIAQWVSDDTGALQTWSTSATTAPLAKIMARA